MVFFIGRNLIFYDFIYNEVFKKARLREKKFTDKNNYTEVNEILIKI